ncbi:MAG: cytochrome c3 family protein, partial [Desulfobacteraceae bacterium]|nr:cytochrome c3 family protein [Desulfobacteraceae bacterium]
MDKGVGMMIKSKFLATILSIFLFLICGIGFAESEIPHVFKYSLSTRNKHYQHSAVFNHSKHAMEYKITCADCHHQLEPGDKAVEESCI